MIIDPNINSFNLDEDGEEDDADFSECVNTLGGDDDSDDEDDE